MAWLNELRGALSVGSGTVIIRRVNLVPGSVQMALGALLGTAVRRGLAVSRHADLRGLV